MYCERNMEEQRGPHCCCETLMNIVINTSDFLFRESAAAHTRKVGEDTNAHIHIPYYMIALLVYFYILSNLWGRSDTLQLKVVAYCHAWLDQAVAVVDTYSLVAEGHVGGHDHLHLSPGLRQLSKHPSVHHDRAAVGSSRRFSRCITCIRPVGVGVGGRGVSARCRVLG